LDSLGRREEARRWFLEGIRRLDALPAAETSDPEFLEFRAAILLHLGDRDGARASLRGFLEAHPEYSYRFPELPASLLDAANSEPLGDRREALRREALAFLRDAIDRLDPISKRSPSDIHLLVKQSRLYEILGQALIDLGRREEAIAALRRFVAFHQEVRSSRGVDAGTMPEIVRPVTILAGLMVPPRADFPLRAQLGTLWDVERSLLSDMGIARGWAARGAWELIRAQHEEAALYRRTDRLNQAREIVAGMVEFARQVVAEYPDDPYAYLALSEAHFQDSKIAWRGAGRREVEDALRRCADSARRALELDPQNVEVQAVVADRQKRLAGLPKP
jgi:tetratricopeptide (TPR) repeat protein